MRIRAALAAVMVLAIAITVGTVLVVNKIGAQLGLHLPTGGRGCVVAGGSGAEVQLDADQMANAATISAIGLSEQLPQRAITVALATAWQESKLRNLPNGDRDSIGLFQQRPSQGWGSRAQISDPRYASRAFYHSLLKVDGWQTMRVTDAAQTVQRSAHPEAYEKWADKAESVARALTGDAIGAVTCVVSAQPAKRGPEATDELAAEVRLDWGDRASTVTVDAPTSLALPVQDVRVGWQYAHWLVAYAKERGIKSVRFSDREWTAKGGSWSKILANAEDSDRVVAEVYGSP